MDVSGIDWAEGHHDVAIIADTGKLQAKCRINDDLDGYRLLLDLLAEHGDTAETPIPVAIETSHGLLVATLRQGPRKTYAVNPMAASRYRDRHGVSRKKSDPGDALVLANIIRTDAPVHRPLPADTDLAQAVAVLARAQQDAVWNRQQVANQLRSLLREHFPAIIEAFRDKPGTLTRPDARRILAVAPTPALAAKLPMWKLTPMLRRAGRRRGIETDAERIQQLFRREAPRQLPLVEEIGDDRTRFATAGGLKAYAGSAPITRASGKRRYVGRRFAKNNRLNHVGHLWAFASLSGSSGADAHYRRRRAGGDWHMQALRHLFNRMLGQLHHCLLARTPFDESIAFPTEPLPANTTAT
ncbi:transposase [Streptomyces lateritius]|uniref:IS110 family transposase n=1 Tax=Streptomyces lateritius TaxID=67313 RepID=UPI001C8C66D3|nr:transposase [Streptomyces lateritius]MBX9427498.1 IS110 family transposase [Streptomyces lateritius]